MDILSIQILKKVGEGVGGGGRILALLLLELRWFNGIMVADVDRTSDERQLSLT